MGEWDPELHRLCAAEYPRLVGALRLRCGRDAYLAEELAQEALARLCRDWNRVARGPSPRAWLYRVAFNLAGSHWRRLAMRQRVEPTLIDANAVLDPSRAAAERMDLRDALDRLSRRERTVIVLRYFVDLPVAQAAQALGMSEQAVRSLSHRAIMKLRTALSDDILPTEARHGS